ncbi:MAG: hypothetical protein E7Z89_04310 [Cyanobacteria bacterium SIG28]|nr:hypothetical protein [Cyanobacteria bacterium SIG28]
MADNEQNNGTDLNKFLIISLVSTVILCIVFAGVNYFVMENLLTQKISAIPTNTEELSEDESAADEIKKGIIVDLGDFILNLCDEAQKKYLKVNVAVEVTQKDTDFPEVDPNASKGGGHGHGAAPAPVDPMEAIQKELSQYKPAIRDAVITNLSSKTSAELASAAGKELAKEQIANEINSILAGEREVLRVSFGQFIIQ